MKPEYYLYALYIVVLVLALSVALIALYRRFSGVSTKQKRLDEELRAQERAREKAKEERLFRLYQNIEEMMDGFESYVQETKESFAAEKAEMDQRMQRLTEVAQRTETAQARAIAGAATPTNVRPLQAVPPQAPAREPVVLPVDNRHKNTRREAVSNLLVKGYTVEQIAQTLDISINEVRLVVYGLSARKAQ